MYSIDELNNIKINTLSSKEARLIFHNLVKSKKLKEIMYFINMPKIKEKLDITHNSFFMEICLYKNSEVIEYILFADEFKPESNHLRDEDRRFAFQSMCASGNVEKALKIYKAFNINQDSLNKALQLACTFGRYETVKMLLNSQIIKEKADIHYDNETALNNACREGFLEIVKYLIESPEIMEHANIHIELHGMNDYPFVLASENGRDDIVKYLMKVEGKNKPNIESGEYSVVKQYLLNGKLDMLKYIIEEENLNLHLDNDYLFIFASKNKAYHIIEYLVLEKNIDINASIANDIEDNNDKIINQIIEKRNLLNKMKNKLEKERGNRKKEHNRKI